MNVFVVMNGRKQTVLERVPRERVNPYLTGAGMILRRIQWDLRPVSWICRARLNRWRDRFNGQRAVILCNGPSLNKVDFNMLSGAGVFTFGLNKINLLFDRTSFRPSCIVSVNRFVIEQNKEFFNSTELPMFLGSVGSRWVSLRENVNFFHTTTRAGDFARDCALSVNEGGTVTYVALQLAFHMGFQDVALVGCDHSFGTRGPPNEKVKAGSSDGDHFDPRYFSDGVTWQLPDLTTSELHYERARDIYAHFGRRVVNCTEGGHLEVFERAGLAEFLGAP